MNRSKGASCSGEGGEDEKRFTKMDNGDSANSRVKQIASARFGVTINYLNNCNEIEIKMAQGAKPGEGGQLPGFKVTKEIAKLRHSTPGVTLISPLPHHYIYSIEDLAQLIDDLKQINPNARIGVTLVASSGIGTIAAWVAKSKADNDGVYIVPAFTGLGAPYWKSEVTGVITGLRRNTDWKNLVRAVIESVAYQSYDLFKAMRNDGSITKIIKIDGGMATNDWFAQFLADILNTKVLRPVIQETTALGVAFFAGLQVGEFKSLNEIKYKWKKDAIFSPKISKKLRNNLLQGWQQAIRKTLA